MFMMKHTPEMVQVVFCLPIPILLFRLKKRVPMIPLNHCGVFRGTPDQVFEGNIAHLLLKCRVQDKMFKQVA